MEQEKCPFCGGVGECLWHEIHDGEVSCFDLAPCEELEE